MKRGNKILLLRIIIAILVLLGIIMLAFIFINKKEKEPRELLKEYMECINKRNYTHMYSMIDQESVRFTDEELFKERNAAIYEGIDARNVRIKIIDFNDEDSVKYETLMDTVCGTISFENIVDFKKIDGKYKILWDDTLIFPHLSANDKVRVRTIEAKRGEILDRNRKVIAGVGIASSVGLVKGKLRGNGMIDDDIEKIAELLEVEPSVISKKLSAKWVKDDSFVPIKTIPKVGDNQIIAIDKDSKVKGEYNRQRKLLSISGVKIVDIEVRHYPLGEEAAHLVGYVQNVTAQDLEKHKGEGYTSNSVIGKSGLEGLYEKKLRGKNGCKIIIVDSEGREKAELAYNEVEHGQNIHLTIDSDIQRELYRKFRTDKSCSVAINPYTGEVLALVSTPSYDNNDFIFGLTSEKWDSLNNDKNRPLYNRFRQRWCPGSTFKSITALIGLQLGTINPKRDYGSEGLRWQKDSSWGSYYITTLHTYKPVVLENALIYSDNIYFAKAALEIGIKKLETYLNKVGFNSEIPFEIKMSKSQYSNLNGIETQVQLADSGYGQGQMLINPLHLACIYSAFNNDGNIIDPFLDYEWSRNENSKYWIREVFKQDVVEEVKKGLIQVVNNPHGTAYEAHRKDVVLAGKTGTAEIKVSKEDTSGTELGWFSVFTTDKATKKPILIVSMVEDVKERGGSAYVVKKDKEVLQQWFKTE